jgi:hypothetical protein
LVYRRHTISVFGFGEFRFAVRRIGRVLNNAEESNRAIAFSRIERACGVNRLAIKIVIKRRIIILLIASDIAAGGKSETIN